MVDSDCPFQLDLEDVERLPISMDSTPYLSRKSFSLFDEYNSYTMNTISNSKEKSNVNFTDDLEIFISQTKNSLFGLGTTKKVSFYQSVNVVLIPTRHEFTFLFPDLWYTVQDLQYFENDANYEELHKKHRESAAEKLSELNQSPHVNSYTASQRVNSRFIPRCI